MLTRSEQTCFGGRLGFYSHPSASTGTEMRFAVYQPPQAVSTRVPALYFLAGLTCNEETFFIKAGAQRVAAELGLMLVACDTSPRGLNIPGDSEHWDFGVGAGYYLDAESEPWSSHYRMGHYVNDELPSFIEAHFPASLDQRGIFGHSMGGHGALVTALRNPQRWTSVSALAPICNPSEVPWGQKAFERFLGSDRQQWLAWDASHLMRKNNHPGLILVDQGLGDQFLSTQLRPEVLQEAADAGGQALRLRLLPGYDHSYWFIQSVMDDHVRHHARQLREMSPGTVD